MRGCIICLALTSTVFGQQTPPSSATRGASVTLRQAGGPQMLIGTAVSSRSVANPKLASLIAEQFDCLTAENEMKPVSLQSMQASFSFERADRIVAFAKAHNMQVIGHNLCWHSQAPRWLFQDGDGQPLPREAVLANLKAHIEAVVKHFKGEVKGWDVVNEAVNDGPSPYLRNTPARRAIGDDFVVKAFEFAHQADPDVELYYNDYNIERGGKRERALHLIRQIKAAGADRRRRDPRTLAARIACRGGDQCGIRAFAGEGLKVMITELDVDVLPRGRGFGADVNATERQGSDSYRAGLPEAVQKKLADRYGALFSMFMRHPEVTRVTFWGVTDGDSWLNGFPVRGRTNYPLLFDRQMRPKPAFDAVIKALQSNKP